MPDIGNSQCKGSEAGQHLICLKNEKSSEGRSGDIRGKSVDLGFCPKSPEGVR